MQMQYDPQRYQGYLLSIHFLMLIQFTGGLGPIPTVIREEVGYTLDGPSVCHRPNTWKQTTHFIAYIHTFSWCKVSNDSNMDVFGLRKEARLQKEHTQAPGEHENTQRRTCAFPGNSGNSANLYTVLPSAHVAKCFSSKTWLVYVDLYTPKSTFSILWLRSNSCAEVSHIHAYTHIVSTWWLIPPLSLYKLSWNLSSFPFWKEIMTLVS